MEEANQPEEVEVTREASPWKRLRGNRDEH